MSLENLVLDQLVSDHSCIENRTEAQEHLNLMTNAEFLELLSNALGELIDTQLKIPA